MSLSREDKDWIASTIHEAVTTSEDRVYRRIKKGALASTEQRLGEMIGELGRRVDQVDGELKAFREEVNLRFDRLEP